jgi:ppGpp synthetase/RelA/SpoT-type nucleotidyltranferase
VSVPFAVSEHWHFYPMAWTEPEYTVEQVNAAARHLLEVYKADMVLGDEFDANYAVVNNWRASHSFPLNTFQMNLRNAAKKVDADSLVAQRIKRFSSIMAKLDRSPKMKLSQMQDIGGCRAVLASVDNVRDVVNYYRSKSQIKHERGPVDDYIANPKDSGYRGVHLIYKYSSDRKQTYNGLKIEMQVRSRYQHAWATAVETVGTFTGQALKTSIGQPAWLRFFALMGSAIALRERTPLVPGTPSGRARLISELEAYADDLGVVERLNSYANALNSLEHAVENAHWYLLELDPSEGLLVVTGFKLADLTAAEEAYAAAEKKQRAEQRGDAVLVSVESVQALNRAYPNYFADTRVFVELLEQALKGRTRPIALGGPRVRNGV